MRLAALALTSLALLTTPVHAGSAETFLEGINGKWKGGGTLAAGGQDKKTKVRCSLRNEMDGTALKLIGRCASSAGTRPLRGELQPNGASITAKSLRLPGAGSLRSPSARFSGNSLTISGTLRDAGKTVPVRNTITVSGSRMTLKVSAQENGRWMERGTLTFRR